MPQIIDTVSHISRVKKQDVLFITFPKCEHNDDHLNYEKYEKRNDLIKFLNKNNIPFSEAFAYEFYGWYSYDGCLYIDLEFDSELGDNQKDSRVEILDKHLMIGDKFKDNDIRFWCMLYSVAMKNSEFDEPGFWDDF